MLSHFRKKRIRNLIYSKLSILVLAAVVFLLASSVWGVYEKERSTSEKREKREAELKALEQRAAALEAEIEKLSSERGVEEEIRQKYEVAREGEHVIVIVDEREENERKERPPESRFWERLFDWF